MILNYKLAKENHQAAIKILVPTFESKKIENPYISYQPIGDKIRLRTALYLKAQTYQQKHQDQNQIPDLKAAYNTYLTLDTLITQTRQGFKAVGSKYFLQQEIVPIYEQAISVALDLFQQTKDSAYYETAYELINKNKAIILIEDLQDEKIMLAAKIPADSIAKVQALKKKFQNLEAAIYDAYQEGDTSLVQQHQATHFDTKRTYDKLIDQLKIAYPNYKDKYEPDTKNDIKTIQRQLESNRAVIEYFVGEQYIFITTITNDIFKIESLSKPADFDVYCKEFIQMSRGNNLEAARFSKISYQLYQDLLSPVLDNLEGISRLTFILDDLLLQIPFDELLTSPYTITPNTWGDTAIPYLIKDYALSQVYASSLLFNKQEEERLKKATKTFLGIGIVNWDYTSKDTLPIIDSAFQERFKGQLIYSDDEVIGIQSIIGGDTLINKKATKQFIIDNAHKYGIIQISSHGFSNEESPYNSGLVLAKTVEGEDNILRVSDIYGLELNAKMVVLSACQTLAGTFQKGEGMRTLARAFAYAGCPNLVATLWNIPDASSKDIFIQFYRNLKQGQPRDVALQQAKLHYLRETDDANKMLPHRWAQTVLIGDTSPIYFGPSWAKIATWSLSGIGLSLGFLFLWRSRKKRI